MTKVYETPGSETSAESARLMEWKAGALERAVLELIAEAGPQGMADFEIDERLSGNMNGTARPRRCSLRDKGLITDTGETVRNPESGRRQSRWALSKYVSDEVRRANEEAKRKRSEKQKAKKRPPIEAARPECPVERELMAIRDTAERILFHWKEPPERGPMMAGPDWIRITGAATVFTSHLDRLLRIADERMRRTEEEETGQTGFYFGGIDDRKNSS